MLPIQIAHTCITLGLKDEITCHCLVKKVLLPPDFNYLNEILPKLISDNTF